MNTAPTIKSKIFLNTKNNAGAVFGEDDKIRLVIR